MQLQIHIECIEKCNGQNCYYFILAGNKEECYERCWVGVVFAATVSLLFNDLPLSISASLSMMQR